MVDLYKLYHTTCKEVKVGTNYQESMTLYSLVEKCKDMKGDIAEVGVWHGGSAKIICEAKGDKKLYLFDTFAGIDIDINNIAYREDGYKCDLDVVKKYLENYSNIYFYKGVFPKDTRKYINSKKFCLVNIDIDNGEAIYKSMESFYPLLVKGGYYIIHDYRVIDEVTYYVDKFVNDKNVEVILVRNSQCIIQKK